MSLLLALAGLGLLLLAGLALWLGVAPLRRLLLPAPLLGGVVGLAFGPFGFDVIPREAVAVWASVPAVLINVVFAGLFLGVAVPSPATIARLGGPLVRFSVIGALGQYVIGLLLVTLVFTPLFGTDLLFACLLEVGFSGGHGTASAMTSVFAAQAFPAGGPLGQMSATLGLITGVAGGVAIIQHAVRRGWVQAQGDLEGAAGASGLVPASARRPIATGTVTSDVLEPFSLHLAVVGVAILIGWVLWRGARAVHPSLDGLPLFPLAMIGGMVVQAVAQRTGAATYLDRGTVQRVTGLSLDLLVAAAVATMQLDLVRDHVLPFAVLMAAGIAWCVWSFLWLAPRMLPRDWFEQGLVVYGTQTGVAAVGLMLLRIVDPGNRTTAAQAFAARSMVVSPLLGGGAITAVMPLLLRSLGPWPVLAALVAVCLACYAWPRREAAI